MKSFVYFILLSCLLLNVSGQNSSEIKTLEDALKEQNHDTVIVRLTNELALQYKFSDTLKAYELLQNSFDAAKKIDYEYGLGLYYESLGKIKYYQGQYENAIQNYKQAKEYYKKTDETGKLAGVSVDEGNANLFLARYNVALEKYESALQVFQELKNTNGMSRCLNNMGIIYKNFGEYEKALKSYEKVIQLYIGSDNDNSLADTYINVGVVHVLQGDYHHALENFTNALSYAEKSGNKEQKAICLMNSGVIHNKMSDYKRALEYYEEALAVSTQIGDKVEISKCLTNIGTNYITLEEYDLAKDYINRGLKLKMELGDKKSISDCYNFLAEIYYHLDEYSESIALDEKAIEMKREINDPEGLARCFNNSSRTYLALENEAKALQFADSSLQYSKNIGALEQVVSAYFLQKEIMKKKGDYKKAFELGELYKIYSDSLMSENKSRAVNEIEFRYKSRVLEEENERLLIQSELDAVLIQRHKKIFILGMLALLMIAFSVILLFTIQSKQKQYNHSLQKKNQIITKQNVKLDTFNRTKDKILSVITHDLRGTIGNQLTALSVLAKEEFRDEDERKIVFSRLANSATLSLELLENLTIWTKIQEDLLSFHPEEAYLDKTFEEVTELFHESINNKDLELISEIKEEYTCFYDQYMIKTVLKNLFSNAIKFSLREGCITYGINIDGDSLQISISDKGIGISDGEISQLKKGVVSKMRRGTENEKGSGLGYSLIKTFLDYHKSELSIKSSKSIGTTVSFTLPMKRPS